MRSHGLYAELQIETFQLSITSHNEKLERTPISASPPGLGLAGMIRHVKHTRFVANVNPKISDP